MKNTSGGIILGLDQQTYTLYFYYVLIAGFGLGLVSNLFSLIGLHISLISGIGALCGMAGLIMGLLGYFVFKKDFKELELSHFKFVLITCLGFFVVSLAIGLIIFVVSLATHIILATGTTIETDGSYVWEMLAILISLIISVVYGAILWSCYTLWKDGTHADLETVKARIRSLIKR